MKKKVDSRIKSLIESSVANHHRGLLVLVGDRGKDQVVNLHYMMSKAAVKSRPSVLWCYKTELGFSSNKKKRIKNIQKSIRRGLLDPNVDDPFELFISSTNIRYTYYSETQKILGNTYGMCVLQDFEAITPNILARTIETVEGGGLIIILLKTMTSLRHLYSMAMDVHSKLKTEAHSKIVPRFNERFLLSLADCPGAIVADDELNVLPLSSHVKKLQSQLPSQNAFKTKEDQELEQLKSSLVGTEPIGPIVAKTKTIDQAKAVLTFFEAISEKTLRSTVALTASRGRGKSAALGLAVASAIAQEYSNIFVTSPSPENLTTFFEFLFIGFDALEYTEHVDYEILQSTDPEMNKCIVRVNIFRSHRQTVQYVDPTEAAKVVTQAELLVIDEAAAIPLPIVKSLLGPYLVFISSTVTGYEGTGRSLSLKLIQQMRNPGAANLGGDSSSKNGGGRVFREVIMETPVRYGSGDPVEIWLYDLLCLDAGSGSNGGAASLQHATAHPDDCQLYMVDRDALFSRHKVAEAFLTRIMSLFVASHYKNSPNDLQILSDAPAHRLFVLLGPTNPNTATLPDILCAIQVAFEGEISKVSVKSSMSRGHRASGDLVPWTIVQQFQEAEFAGLSGLRIVRISTHPDVQKMGYGSRAIQLLLDYFENKVISLHEDAKDLDEDRTAVDENEGVENIREEKLKPRKNIPPLLKRLTELPSHPLDYVSVSFGITQPLFSFWKKHDFFPLYIRLTQNQLTGEHTCIMIRAMRENSSKSEDNIKWLKSYYFDFRKRFIALLGYDFRNLPPGLALSILDDHRMIDEEDKTSRAKTESELRNIFSAHDLRRLEAYSKNMLDYHVIIDLIPNLATMFFLGYFGPDMNLSAAQSAMLMSLGLQKKTVSNLEKDLGLPSNQILALFNKIIRKISSKLREEEENRIAKDMDGTDGELILKDLGSPLNETLDEELRQDVKNRKTLGNEKLAQYAIKISNEGLEDAVGQVRGSDLNVISVKRQVGEDELKHDKSNSKKKKHKSKK